MLKSNRVALLTSIQSSPETSRRSRRALKVGWFSVWPRRAASASPFTRGAMGEDDQGE